MSKQSILTTKALTANESKFAKFIANGYTLSRAYLMAFPSKSELSPSTIRSNASRLATKHNIVTEVATSIEKQSRLARLSEERIEEVLTDGAIGDKDAKVADVAMFMYEQANGKATQKVQMESKHISINFNLSGSDEPIPKEVLEQLADDD